MTFGKKHRAPGQNIVVLPWQELPPTFQQLNTMQKNCVQSNGRQHHLSFGDPQAEYTLVVALSQSNARFRWTFYVRYGDTSQLLWDKESVDIGYIHHLIIAQFPGVELKSTAWRAVESDDAMANAAQNAKLREQQSTSSRLLRRPTFAGNLKELPFSSVAQSIAAGILTGRLEIETELDLASVFFVDGIPVHTYSRGLEGEEAFVELICLQKGQFRFYPADRTFHQTIRRGLDNLLTQGAEIRTQQEEMAAFGVHPKALLLRRPGITESQFESLLSDLNAQELELSKRFFLAIANGVTIDDVVRKFSLWLVEWVPIVFRLLKCGLIAVDGRAPLQVSSPQPAATIDWSRGKKIESWLKRPDTDIFTYPAFLYYVQLELRRWQRFARPFSIILLRFEDPANESTPFAAHPSFSDIEGIIRRTNSQKRKTDILSHYASMGFALLLRETDGQLAAAFTDRLLAELNSSELLDSDTGRPIFVRAGVACIPDTCSTLEALLARAKPRSSAELMAKAHEKVRVMVDNALDLLCSIDEEMKFIEVNPAWENALGYEPKELEGSFLSSFFQPEDIQPTLKKIRNLMASSGTNKPIYTEIKIVAKDGRIVPFQWSLRWSKEERLIFGVGRDVSKQKENERLKAELIRMVSHDLRSPAMAVDGFLEMLESKLKEPLPVNVKSMHSAALSANNRVLKLVSDLLEYEQLSESVVVLDGRNHSIAEIFAESVDSIAGAPDIKIHVEPTDLMLWCDKDRIVQVVVNLLGNAVKFSPSGSVVSLSAHESATEFVLSVRDSGPGIAAEALESIFLPFKQAGGRKAHATKGYGLGLAIAKALAELHGGRLTVMTEIGKGSVFSLVVPKGRQK